MLQNLPEDIAHYKFWHELIQLPFIEQIYLYGSRARGTHEPRSDIDLAFKCSKLAEHDWTKLFLILDQADTLLKIDYVNLSALKPENPLTNNIIKEGILIYDRNITNKHCNKN